jgi:hypothetical protein
MSDIDVTNPGLVNVADQADGETRIDQEITVSRPSSNSGPTVQGITFADGMITVNQPVTVSPSQNSGPTEQGIAFADGMVEVDQPVTVSPSQNSGTTSPVSPNTISTTQNTAINQDVQQFNRTINVYP